MSKSGHIHPSYAETTQDLGSGNNKQSVWGWRRIPMGLKFCLSLETPRSAFKEPSSLSPTSLSVVERQAHRAIRRSEFIGWLCKAVLCDLSQVPSPTCKWDPGMPWSPFRSSILPLNVYPFGPSWSSHLRMGTVFDHLSHARQSEGFSEKSNYIKHAMRPYHSAWYLIKHPF